MKKSCDSDVYLDPGWLFYFILGIDSGEKRVTSSVKTHVLHYINAVSLIT